MFNTITSINTIDDNANDLLATVTFIVKFNVPRDDAHDFDDAVREWAKYWKVFSAAHKAKSKDKELNNAED